MKVYTRTGDDGTTALFGGGRVRKDHPRVDAYGTVDELNATLGIARAAATDDRLAATLAHLQNDLFALGADLATPASAKATVRRFGPEDASGLEQRIDEADEELAPLKTFVLPGGTPCAAHLHLARTVCRRAERLAVPLLDAGEISAHTIAWLNRLSDLLFTLARLSNARAGVQDIAWTP